MPSLSRTISGRRGSRAPPRSRRPVGTREIHLKPVSVRRGPGRCAAMARARASCTIEQASVTRARLLWHRSSRRTPAESQPTSLPLSRRQPRLAARDADGEAVGIRIVGDHELGVDCVGAREGEVERAGLLRIREGDGRERPIRPQLLGRRRPARRIRPRRRRGGRSPSRRRAWPCRRPSRPRGAAAQRRGRVDVGIEDLLARACRSLGRRGAATVPRRDRGDVRGDLARRRAARSASLVLPPRYTL